MPERIEVQSQRIPYVPVVRQIEPAIQVPTPVVRQVPQPNLVVPSFEAPSYTPPTTQDPTPDTGLRTPPNREMDIDGVAEYATGLSLPDWRGFDEEKSETIEIAGLGLPVPKPEVLAIAGTTAVSSVAMALAAKSIVEMLVKAMKPVIKQVVLKIKHKLGMKFSHREEQLYFSFEHKGLNKKLKADFNADLERQLLRQSK
tara:strand:- start:329 stop:928 length:600 start_codon:yes stop_codon:yes gene_type:complete